MAGEMKGLATRWPVTPEVPASILQMHPDFILVGDEEAFSLI